MKVKVITVATYESPGLKMLKKSMDKHHLDYHILCRGEKWRGFGMKVIETVKYLKSLTHDYTHFIFVDAYDVVFLGDMDRIEARYRALDGGVIFSGEKGCWPDPGKAEQYPGNPSAWRYLNSGSYMAPIQDFLEFVSHYDISDEVDDQRYFTNIFLQNYTGDKIKIDSKCMLFQSIAFEEPRDFELTDSLRNSKHGTEPLIIHGNGRTNMSKIYNLI